MSREAVDVEKIAEAVLYEGYLLFPYRRSALKNQQRWTFGGVYPREYSEATGGNDPWLMQTQCLVTGIRDTALEIRVRFLHVVDRLVAENVNGESHFVEELRIGGQTHRPWEEAIEREIRLDTVLEDLSPAADGKQRIVSEGPSSERHQAKEFIPSPQLRLGDLLSAPRSFPIEIPADSDREPLLDPDGRASGALVRQWRALQGTAEVRVEPLDAVTEGMQSQGEATYRLTVRIMNTLPWQNQIGEEASRNDALRQSFISTHTILKVRQGAFLSLLEPPEGYLRAAGECENIKTWPVLVGEIGEHHTLLSSPIILYDYPQISPESQGNYFDATEIDELLALTVMILTDEEKQEMRETDVHAREILDRTEGLSEEQLMKLHGAVRSLQPVRGAEV